MNIKDRITRVLGEQLGIDESDIKPEKYFEHDLGCDSLDLLEVIMALEEEFEIEISNEDAEKIATVQQSIDYVTGRVGGVA